MMTLAYTAQTLNVTEEEIRREVKSLAVTQTWTPTTDEEGSYVFDDADAILIAFALGRIEEAHSILDQRDQRDQRRRAMASHPR